MSCIRRVITLATGAELDGRILALRDLPPLSPSRFMIDRPHPLIYPLLAAALSCCVQPTTRPFDPRRLWAAHLFPAGLRPDLLPPTDQAWTNWLLLGAAVGIPVIASGVVGRGYHHDGPGEFERWS